MNTPASNTPASNTPASTAGQPATWPGADGKPVSCREKLKMLADNQAELLQVMQDAFEDAVLMGVDEDALRRILHDAVDGLHSPRRPR